MRTNIKWLIVGIFLASAVTVWAATTHLGRLTLREVPEITGSNAETISNTTNGSWTMDKLIITSASEITGSNGEYWTNTSNGIWGTDATVNTLARYTVDSSPILKTLTVAIDSLGVTDVDIPGVITWESDVTVLRAQVSCATAVAGNDCLVIFHSGATADTVTVASGAQSGATTTDYSFSASAICSVLVSDGSAGTGGAGANLILQYTDKND